MVDRSQHPRFAIGESSTPLADFLLEQIASRYGLPELLPLSRWGSWQRDLPWLRAGKKRGFSYFAQPVNKPFTDTAHHARSLLVAASSSDAVSDTHWMRSDVDQWFAQQAASQGVVTLENFLGAEVRRRGGSGWLVTGVVDGEETEVQCDFVVDATGNGTLIGEALSLDRLDHRLQTQTGALYGHFRGVGSMSRWLEASGMDTRSDPFDADAAAQHHLIDDGWIWMLRFNEGTTSVGIVRPTAVWLDGSDSEHALTRWASILRRYPTVERLMSGAELISPAGRDGPRLGWLPRISRLWAQGAGQGWAMLPGTVGIVDPLHSTGIAHNLSGVARLAAILLSGKTGDRVEAQIDQYSRDVVQEILWIDRIVACCYAAARESFELFAAVCSLYFVAAIHCERQLATGSGLQEGFLLHRSAQLRHVAHATELRIEAIAKSSAPQTLQRELVSWLREQLAPWNDVGLMDPKLAGRIARSAAPK